METKETLQAHYQQPPSPKGPAQLAFTGEGEYQKGIAVVLSVNIVWGLLPMYWKQLTHVPPVEVLCHRAFWGFLLVLFLLWLWKGFAEVGAILRNRRNLMFMAGCSFSHMFNWGFYIWAVASGRILDASLGHYLLPMFSVLCGFIIFRERPRRIQWLAIFVAGSGVGGMILWFGILPWVGLVIAINAVIFATLRKQAPVNAVPGMAIELILSAPFLWGYLIYLTATDTGIFGTVSVSQNLWLIGAGIVTIVPQLGYAYGLGRIPLTAISLMQYIPPTGNFLVGLLMFGERLSSAKLFGFSFIWAGLIIFTLEGFHFRWSVRRQIKKA